MLVRITNRCTMGCNHCLVKASPDGEHMTQEVFVQTVKFVADVIGVPLIMLSGGEPTEHPDIVMFLIALKKLGFHTSLLSNGEFLHAEDEELKEFVLRLVDMVQVTNDKRYYPREVADYDHPKVMIERRLRSISPFGRAVENKLEFARKTPHCFNLRSATRQYNSFAEAVRYLRARAVQGMQGGMCTPSINPDGSIVAGESPFCSKIGTVYDDELTLTQNVRNLTCDKCGLTQNLNQEQKRAIGEARIILL